MTRTDQRERASRALRRTLESAALASDFRRSKVARADARTSLADWRDLLEAVMTENELPFERTAA